MKNLIALLSAFTLAFTGVAGVKSSSAPLKSKKIAKVKCVTDMTGQVISYLAKRGYSVYSISRIPGTQNFKAYTRKCNITSLTKVYISGGYIVGHEDVPI